MSFHVLYFVSQKHQIILSCQTENETETLTTSLAVLKDARVEESVKRMLSLSSPNYTCWFNTTEKNNYKHNLDFAAFVAL